MTSFKKAMQTIAGNAAIRCGLARVTRRFRHDEAGATAVEFTIVALPFFALMFAILETAMTFFAGQTLDTFVGNAARLIRTGQAQQAGLTEATFKDTLCSSMPFALFTCADISLDVKRYITFGDIDLAPPVDANGNLIKTGTTYVPGNGGDIVVVRAYYEWPVFVNMLGNDLANEGNGKHLLISTVAFRNEPFPW